MNNSRPDCSIAELIDKYHESQQEPPRGHLGASILGHPCDRWLWLSFRWAVQEKFSGRMLRLFRRGNVQETTIIADLRAIGMDIRIPGSKQTQVDFGAHVSGSLDAIIQSGVPGNLKQRHIGEFKTHNKKSFNELEKHGVKQTKPQHWIQAQVYMYGSGIGKALYFAICKDDDRIYTEIIELDENAAKAAVARGKRVALSERMPEPMPNASKDYFLCKFCAAHKFCYETKLTEHVSCRTCAHSTPHANSTWNCERYKVAAIPLENQRKGCTSHVIHPDLTSWQLDQDASAQWVAAWVINGKLIKNGNPRDEEDSDASVFSSAELLSNLDACLNQDDSIRAIRQQLGGEIQG